MFNIIFARLVRIIVIVSILFSVVPLAPSSVRAAAGVAAVETPAQAVAASSPPASDPVHTIPLDFSFPFSTFNFPLNAQEPPPPAVEILPPAVEVLPPAVEPAPVESKPALSLALRAEPESAAPGEVVTFTLIVANLGEAAMGEMALDVAVPDNLRWIADQADWSYDAQANRLSAKMDGLQDAEAKLTLRLQAGDKLDELATLTVEAKSGDELLGTASASVWVAQPTRAAVGPEGGTLRVESPDGLVTIEFPAGAVSAETAVTYRRYAPEPDSGRGLRFALEASGEAAFAAPVTVTILAPELISVTSAIGTRPIISRYDAAQKKWTNLHTVVDAKAGTLTAQVEGAAILSAGQDLGVGWKLLYNPPTVAMFSGAATYNYSIQVPAGRNGLQPSLNLSYNSRRIDGILGWVDSDWVGLGWSLEMIEIVRHNVHIEDDSSYIDYDPAFNLLINGTGHKLYPGSNDVDYNHGRYYAKDAPGLYVLRVNDLCTAQAPCDGFIHGSDNNFTGEYWIVRLPDGTKVTLGSQLLSEQVIAPTVCGSPAGCAPNKYGGHEVGTAVYRWRADSFEDVYGNRMEMSYAECQSTNGGRDSASWPTQIRYNNYNTTQWGTVIQFQVDPCGGQPGAIPEYIFGRHGRLNAIDIWHLGQPQPLRRIVLGYEEIPRWSDNILRDLVSITEQSGDGSQALPMTTFNYTDYANKYICSPAWPVCNCPTPITPECLAVQQFIQEGFEYPRLSRVDNGYGGVDTFSYVNDNRNVYDSRSVGYNYRVIEHTTRDGIHSQLATQSYEYGTPCYNAGYGEGGGTRCTSPDNGVALVGFDVVTETITGYASEWLAKAVHRFHVDDAFPNESPLIGRERRTQALNASSSVLQQSDTLWASMLFGNNVPFVYTSQVTATEYSDGTSLAKRTSYAYDGYGNVTHAREYASASASTPYRTTLTSSTFG